MKNLIGLVSVSFMLSACDPAFMRGVAEGLANRPTTVYSPAASSSTNNQLDQIRQRREAKKQERNQKNMCENTGGRWRVGRCKY